MKDRLYLLWSNRICELDLETLKIIKTEEFKRDSEKEEENDK